MRAQREQQREGVRDDEDDRHGLGHPELRQPRRGFGMHAVKQRGKHEGHDRQREHAGAHPGTRAVELELRPGGAAGDEGEPEDEQQVAEDAAGDRRLHQLDQPRAERHDRDDELGRVAERRVEQAPDGRTGAVGQVLGRLAHVARERQHPQARGEEHPHRGRVHDVAQHNADRHRQQQEEPPGNPASGRTAVGHPRRRRAGRRTRRGRGSTRLPARGAGLLGGFPVVAVRAGRGGRRAADLRPHAIGCSSRLDQHLAQRPARLEQRRQQEVFRGEGVAGVPRFPGGQVDEALGVRGIGQLLDSAARPAAPTRRLEPLASPTGIQAEPLEHRPSRALGPHKSQHDVLCAYGIVLQAHRLCTGLIQCPLRAGAQRMRVHARRRSILGQSGFASSTSMMGMPSSTG